MDELERDRVMRLDNQICFAIYACSREINKLYYPLLKEINLTYTQYITMLALWEKDRVSVKELGTRLYLDSGTLTPLLKKLEQMGFVTRVRDKNDERIVLIELTEAGAALKESAAAIPEKLFCNSGLSSDEALAALRQTTDLLHKLQHQYDKEENSNV
ncbi:MarR family transcriptional regulator [Cohnella faecalis]|uniref:MarR family transcriptional regulator n=1 Tax=Cohnella faecalis TaxID=2315694 RepID=A0A398D089_9BACL|nr:MarR family transcriptional regulator [Cohnella faecalis]